VSSHHSFVGPLWCIILIIIIGDRPAHATEGLAPSSNDLLSLSSAPMVQDSALAVISVPHNPLRHHKIARPCLAQPTKPWILYPAEWRGALGTGHVTPDGEWVYECIFKRDKHGRRYDDYTGFWGFWPEWSDSLTRPSPSWSYWNLVKGAGRFLFSIADCARAIYWNIGCAVEHLLMGQWKNAFAHGAGTCNNCASGCANVFLGTCDTLFNTETRKTTNTLRRLSGTIFVNFWAPGPLLPWNHYGLSDADFYILQVEDSMANNRASLCVQYEYYAFCVLSDADIFRMFSERESLTHFVVEY